MIVCICNRLSDRHVRDAALAGASRASQVYAACGCRPDCGQCAQDMQLIVDEVTRPCGNPLLLAAE